MELTALIKRAQAGDVEAFTVLTRRYQNVAFGSALAILGDRHLAEDAVQEAFIAAYFSLTRLEAPESFPSWLRGIVRHQCHRILRRRRLELLPLESAEHMATETGHPDAHLVREEQRRTVLAAVDALPRPQREVITLFYLQEQSQQDVAAFLGVPVSTVNTRLHAARQSLKRRLSAMAEEAGRTTRRDLLRAAGAVTVGALLKDAVGDAALPGDFAERVGEIVRVRGPIIEARFDPDQLPEILSTLTITDETRKVDVTVEVVQRGDNGVVRCIAPSPLPGLQRGMRIARSEAPASTPIGDAVLERAVGILAAPADRTEVLETGIKVIDLFCPIARGGRVGLFGDMRVGKSVVIEELVHSLASRHGGVSLFTFVQAAEVPVLQKGRSDFPRLMQDREDAVQTFFILSERQTDPEYAAALDGLHTVIYLSREIGAAGIWPAINPLASRSRLLDPAIVGEAHHAVARRARELLAQAQQWEATEPPAPTNPTLLTRARKLRRFFSQPFTVAEPWTHLPGKSVPLAETVRACREILDGAHDNLPEDAFMFVGGIAEAREKAARI